MISLVQNTAWFCAISLLVTTAPALYAWLFASFGMWFAFSKTSLAIRTFAFIVGVFLVGLTCATFIERPQTATVLVLFLAFFMFWHSAKLSMTWLAVLVALWLWVLYVLVDARVASSVWFVRLVLISFGMCLPFASLRLLGFRFVKITDGDSGLPMAIATGQSLDEWFGLLDRASLLHVNHAEIMATLIRLLRECGVAFALSDASQEE